MNKYVVFVTEDEDEWAARSDAGRQEVYDADSRFVAALERRGGKVVMGAELAASGGWHTLVRSSGITRRTEGPFAESVEQLGGFYLVECERIETVLEACEQMISLHARIEVAPVVD